jgi:hypothetical protein
MPLRIARFPDTDEARAAARRFNERLQAGGLTEFELGTSPHSKRYPEQPDAALWQQYFLALDEIADGGLEVRGGYLLQYERYRTREGIAPHAFLRLPISEGVVNKAFAPIGARLLQDAMSREIRLCSLGMGGITRPLPRLMAALGWLVREVPFHFRVLHPHRFFRQARILRRSPAMALACDALAWSGLGWLGTRIVQLRPPLPRLPKDTCVTCEPDFGPWADAVWEAGAPHYHFAGVRNGKLLRTLYPVEDGRWIRLVVWRGTEPLGWALLLCTDWKGHKQFGSVRLGSIADCFAPPEHALAVVGAAAGELARRGADLLVSNQTHDAWNAALRRCGFVRGRSNFVFAASPALRKTLGSLEENLGHIHINRGDGDGPINL